MSTSHLTKNHTVWLVIVFCLVVSASLLNQPTVPLYDGVGFPDEPYRFITPPADLPPTHPATQAHGSSTVQNDTNDQLLFPSSQEQGPQIALYLSRHTLKAAPNAKQIDLYALPQAPDAQPSSATISGNVYHITALSDTGPITINGAAPLGTISLRLPQGQPANPVMEYRPNTTTAWRQIGLRQVGMDVYQADLIGMGDYALATAKAAPTASKQSILWPLTIALGSVAIVALLIVAIRLMRPPV